MVKRKMSNLTKSEKIQSSYAAFIGDNLVLCECSTASLGWWWRWKRGLQRTGWRGRSTWGCGGGDLSWQPGWRAGFQTVIRYMERKSQNVKGCNFEFGRNSETPIMFLGFMCWRWLQGKGKANDWLWYNQTSLALLKCQLFIFCC